MICVLASPLAYSQQRGRANVASPINYETAWRDKNVPAVRITEKITLDGHLETQGAHVAMGALNFSSFPNSRLGTPGPRNSVSLRLPLASGILRGMLCGEAMCRRGHALLRQAVKDGQ